MWYVGDTLIHRQELDRRLRELEDVERTELGALLSAGGDDAAAASLALFQSDLRRSVDALGTFCAAQQYGDANANQLLTQLATLAQNEKPVVDLFRGLGLRALAEGRYDEAVARLEQAAVKAAHVGTKPDRRSRVASKIYHDREIDAAYATIGGLVTGVRSVRDPAAPPDYAIVASTLDHFTATTPQILSIARRLRESGELVTVISTEHSPTGVSRAHDELVALGARVIIAAGANHYQRMASVIAALNAQPVSVALYYCWPIDAVGKVLASAGAAPAQVFLKHTCEQFCGRFDLVLVVSSEKEVTQSLMAAPKRYIGPSIAARIQVEQAVLFVRAQYGLTPDQVILGTFGRLSKCCDRTYTRTMAEILRRAPQARLLLAGPTTPEFDALVRGAFQDEGVGDRVLMLGDLNNTYFGLIKMLDIYCDTLFWRGAQTILEAWLRESRSLPWVRPPTRYSIRRERDRCPTVPHSSDPMRVSPPTRRATSN